MRVSSVVFCGGKNVKIILFKSGTSDTGKADARAAGVQTERIWYVVEFSDEMASRYFYVEPKGFAEIVFKSE